VLIIIIIIKNANIYFFKYKRYFLNKKNIGQEWIYIYTSFNFIFTYL